MRCHSVLLFLTISIIYALKNSGTNESLKTENAIGLNRGTVKQKTPTYNVNKRYRDSLPKFTEEVTNSTVVIGRSAHLKCSVQNLDGYKIAWIKSDSQTLLSIEKTMISRNYRLRVTHSDDSTWYLHIDEAMMSDRGFYMCQINTVPPLIKQGFLQVVVPPNIMDGELSSDVEVSEDSSAKLKCIATGYPAPEIRFRKQEGRMLHKELRGKVTTKVITDAEEIKKTLKNDVEFLYSNTKTQEDESRFEGMLLTIGELALNGVSRDDMGLYLCIANNSVPPSVSKRIIFNVRYRDPEVEVGEQMLAVFLGDDVTLNCTVSAYPKPVVYWHDSFGRMIVTGGKYEITERQVKEIPPILATSLTIRNIDLNDVMTYTCNASIDNDFKRSKSQQIQLHEMERKRTNQRQIEHHKKRIETQKKLKTELKNENNLKKSERKNISKTSPADVPDHAFKPEVFVNPHLNENEAADQSSSSSKTTRPILYLAVLVLFNSFCATSRIE